MRQPVGAASAPQGEAVSAMVRGLVPRTICVATANPHDPDIRADPRERACLPRVVPSRLRAFDAGRSAARRALQALGAPGPVLIGAGGAPAWSEGITGSIAHCDSLALALVARRADHAALGVDVEEDRPLDPDLIPSICSARERDRLPAHDAGHAAMRVFCAKEAAYKCQYPLTGQLLDFDAFDVTLTPGGFSARFTRDVGLFRAGSDLQGRCVTGSGLIVAAISMDP